MQDLPLRTTRAPAPDPQTPHRAFKPAGAKPFVGRAAELAQLLDGFDAAHAGQGTLFVIAGDAGIGKTRLATEFARAARARGATVHWGRCWEASGAPPYWPWVEVVRNITRGLAPAAREEIVKDEPYLAQIAPGLADPGVADGVEAPTHGDPETARFLLFDAVARLLRRASSTTPLVIIIDDFHVADRASLLLLTFLARALADAPVVLVGTYRHREAGDASTLVEPLGELARHGRRIMLGGLGPSDVSRFIETLTGRRAEARLVDDIHDLTDGNPFFVDEVLRLLAFEGRLIDDTAAPRPLAIPDGVRDAVRRRLSSLNPATLQLLEVASVVGREFGVAVLGVAADRGPMAVVDELDDALHADLVVEVQADGRFAFRHALIREAIYDGLTPARRLRLHQRVGEAFEKLAAGDHQRYVAELAHHFLAAAPLGTSDAFVEPASRAARQALRRMAFEEAATLYRRTIDALAFLPPNERRRCELLLGLGQAMEWADDDQGSRSAADEAAAIARRIGAPDLLVRAALGVGALNALKLTAGARCNGATDLLVEALTVAPTEDWISRSLLEGRLALDDLTQGETSRAIERSTRSLAAARLSGDPETVALALIARHGAVLGPDHLAERRTITHELLQIANQTQSREFAMRAHALRVTNSVESGDLQTAGEAIEAHLRLVEETGDPFERWASLIWFAARALLIGEFSQAREFSQRALDLAHTVPGHHARDHNAPMAFVGLQILIDDACGGPPPDPEVVESYRQRYPKMPIWHAAALLTHLRLRREDDVRRDIEALPLQAMVDGERGWMWLAFMSFLSEAINFVNDPDRAAIVYPALLPYAEHNAMISFIACCGSMSRPLGILAATMGRAEEAAFHFEAALTLNRGLGAAPYVATTLHDYGRLLIAQTSLTERRRGRELLSEAVQLATDLGMESLRDRCASLLEAQKSNPVTPVAPDELSLSRDGTFWTLARGGDRVLLKNAKGLAYIAELLRQPGRDIHVLELVSAVVGPSSLESNLVSLAAREGGPADPLIDERARRAYRRALDQLLEQLAEAEAAGEPERVLELRGQVTEIGRELARTTRLGGRLRTTSDAERARVRITRTIHLALRNIVEVAPELGAELARTIRTGTFCSYTPAPSR